MTVDQYLAQRIKVTAAWEKGFRKTAGTYNTETSLEKLKKDTALAEAHTLRRELSVLRALQRKGLTPECTNDKLDDFVQARLTRELKRSVR